MPVCSMEGSRYISSWYSRRDKKGSIAMLDNKSLMEKLYGLPRLFQENMRSKDYVGAKSCYDIARTVAVFLNLDKEHMKELFGERGERGEIIRVGLFPEEKVQKAYFECIKMNTTHEARKYPGIPSERRQQV